MNKNSIEETGYLNNLKHVLIIMRITLFLFFFCILCVSASNSYSQKLTIKHDATSIKRVCEEIEKNSDYIFVFSDNREKILDEKALPLITVNQPNIQVIQQPTKKQITGKVLDEDGDPIIGANIVEIGTTNGTVTDSNGEFSLNVNDNASIRISYIGFLSKALIPLTKRVLILYL